MLNKKLNSELDSLLKYFDENYNVLEKEELIYNDDNLITLFVYGTLRKGMGNYIHHLENKSKYIGTTIIPNMVMKANGIPFCLRTETPNDKIVADIFHIDKEVLKPIDRLEGHPRMYQRVRVKDINNIDGYIYVVDNNKPLSVEEVNFFKTKDNYIITGNYFDYREPGVHKNHYRRK